jgi:hypothetical protein
VDVSPPVTRGVRALRRLLREDTFDLRGLDLASFRDWLGRHLQRWQNDPVFAQRARIRDLRRAHPHLKTLEREHQQGASAEADTPQAARLRRLEQELADTGKAIAGLSAACARAAPEKLPALREKREGFQARERALREEQAGLTRASPERQALLQLDDELRALRAAVGLEREEARLDELLRQQGRHSGRSGASFERLARTLT